MGTTSILALVVVAQLAEWLLLTPEVGGSNIVISKFNITYILLAAFKRRK